MEEPVANEDATISAPETAPETPETTPTIDFQCSST
ncbi:hypothetical protein CRE_11333 [Caenorhabditis remanei]|uniref:Uncharacterized protein n=1 Tax=Caenorhabditis remanei TaxID=31234 RepID=E3N0E2_CAERE|nr:hypothetical protein CRE_11333 [Caenorhabditis remanei]